MKKLQILICSLVSICGLTGCDKDKEDYKYIGQVALFLHEVVYDDYTFDNNRLTVQDYTGSCSVVRNGNFIGRNFDYFFNNVPDFIVRMNASKNRYASIGVSQTSLFKEADLISGNVNKEYFKLIPNVMMDGINEKGVFVCNNVVSNDGVANEGTNPSKEEMGVWFIARQILDKAATADEAIEIMRNYNIVGDLFGYENLHFLIADSNKTYVAEIIGSSLVIEEKTGDEQIMTNFLCNQDEPQIYPSGIERYNLLKANYEMGSTFKGMQDLLYKARFSQSFNPNMDPVWVSDAGLYTYEEMQDPEVISAYKDLLINDFYPGFTSDFANNIRTDDKNEAWWITVHNSTYDIQNRSFKIFVQEDYEHCFEYKI